jgi:organic radical activating enzyme
MIKGRISEVFESVQGEGLYFGEKQIFVRFFGCNLSCKFCDTKLNRFLEYEPQELFEELKLYQDVYHSISFTGGEPLLQKDFLKQVLQLTQKEGYKNYLETNGTLPGELEDVIDYLDFIAMDLKLPSSAEMGKLWGFHRKFLHIALRKEVFLKAIICSATQEQDLREALSLINGLSRSLVLVLQPNSQENDLKMKDKLENFKQICTENNITACIIPQLHKVVGIR